MRIVWNKEPCLCLAPVSTLPLHLEAFLISSWKVFFFYFLIAFRIQELNNYELLKNDLWKPAHVLYTKDH